MSNLEKKVNALIRLSFAETEEERIAAKCELDRLMVDKTPEIAAVDLTNCIQRILKDLGVPSSILGYKYLVCAIKLVVQDFEASRDMTSCAGLYSRVAEVSGTTNARAERGIRHAIESGWQRADMDVIAKYFGGTVHPDKGKPTNREYITNIALVVRQQMGV